MTGASSERMVKLKGNSQMAEAAPIQRALSLPNGARFYRCALQVNPFAYLKKYNKPTSFDDEA